jgi:hypothetical protein
VPLRFGRRFELAASVVLGDVFDHVVEKRLGFGVDPVVRGDVRLRNDARGEIDWDAVEEDLADHRFAGIQSRR